MNSNQNLSIDIVMLSTLDKNVGGRETWLYNFLPELLKNRALSCVNVLGYREESECDHTSEIQKLGLGNHSSIELKPILFVGKPNRVPKAFSMMKRLRKWLKIRNQPPDFVLAMGVLEWIMVVSSLSYRSSKKVVWLRSIFSQEKAHRIPWFLTSAFIKLEARLLRKADVLLCNGKDIQEFYEKFGLKLHVIENGVDTQKWNLEPPRLNLPIKVAYIGRLTYIKGIEHFFEVIEIIKKSNDTYNFEFHLVGPEGEYEKQVEKFESKNWLIRHGTIPNDELPEFLQRIDVCVALSYSAKSGAGGTSNAMMEQMAASRIIVAWDNIIFRNFLNSQNGYLVPQYGSEDLATAFRQIYKSKAEAIVKGIEARKTIAPYTHAKNAKKFLSIVGISDRTVYSLSQH